MVEVKTKDTWLEALTKLMRMQKSEKENSMKPVKTNSGRWLVEISGSSPKFDTEQEALNFISGLQVDTENGSEETEDPSQDFYKENFFYEEEDDEEEEDSTSFIGIGEEDSESESEEE